MDGFAVVARWHFFQLLELPVKIRQVIEPAFIGDAHNGFVIIAQQFTGMANPHNIQVFYKGHAVMRFEEIAERGKETFIHAGGEQYEMIPCMNIQPAWVQTVSGMIKEKMEA